MAGFPASASLRLLIRPERPGRGCRGPRGAAAAPALPAQALTPPSARINSALGSRRAAARGWGAPAPCVLREEPGHSRSRREFVQARLGMGIRTRTGLFCREMREIALLWPGRHPQWQCIVLVLSVQAPFGYFAGRIL